MKANNIKKWKSSLLGLALIVFSSVLIYNGITHDYWINGVLYAIGLLLFFTGDDWVERIEDLLFNYLKKKSGEEK